MIKLIPSFILVFLMCWMVLFFIILPIGVEINPNPEPGHADSAPVKPNVLKKTLLSAFIALLLTIAYLWFVYLR